MGKSPAYNKQTRTYKTHGDTPIKLDVYLPLLTTPNDDKDGNLKPRPILLFFHGGYLVRSLLSITLSCAIQPDTLDLIM
jgi:acetyl esterase/lipase